MNYILKIQNMFHKFKEGVVDNVKIFDVVQLKVWYWLIYKLKYAIFSYSDRCLDFLVCTRMV